jgi:hypothetical protein
MFYLIVSLLFLTFFLLFGLENNSDLSCLGNIMKFFIGLIGIVFLWLAWSS